MAELRARAVNNGVSLSAYARTVLTREVPTPPTEEVMARIATREAAIGQARSDLMTCVWRLAAQAMM